MLAQSSDQTISQILIKLRILGKSKIHKVVVEWHTHVSVPCQHENRSNGIHGVPEFSENPPWAAICKMGGQLM